MSTYLWSNGPRSEGPKIYEVSQVNALVKAALQEGMPSRMTVRGEIRDWKHHHSGHCYFALKDANGVLPAVMWAGQFKAVRFSPAEGMSVLATGYVDVYLAGGRYQFYVEAMEPEGKGALQVAFEQRVAKLQAEGLFDPGHKKPLPPYPQRIGVLTSESGAALHDIHQSLSHRWPVAQLLLYPVPVQGQGAADQIARAIRDLNRRNLHLRLDLLIVGRGGGSIEDLWAFNEEVLARAIYASKIPTISAVGHEVDVTIADLVADARASTPTQAGVVAVPDAQEVLEDIAHCQRRLQVHVQSRLHLSKSRLQTVLAAEAFKRPRSVLGHWEQVLDELTLQVRQFVLGALALRRTQVYGIRDQVARIEPHRLLGRCSLQAGESAARVAAAMASAMSRSQMALESQTARLCALDPKAVLRRGYTITTCRTTGRLVLTSDDVQLGDILVTETASENSIESQVVGK